MRWFFLFALTLSAADVDQDSLPDKFEQQLLEQFVPRFLVSPSDCAVLPVEFAPREATPRPLARHRTLYGFVTPHASGEIEMHYYHFWVRDCGRFSHPIDIEHVSVLLRSPDADHSAKHWYAVAWAAAGHQGTICDTAHGVRAHLLNAAQRGPTVWVSHGKHASFLSQERCSGGCGGDRCDSAVPWRPREIVNLGSRDYPLHDAVWVQSSAFAGKMRSEFTPAIETVLTHSKGIAGLYPVLVPVKATVFAGGATLDALGTGKQYAGHGIITGATVVTNSLRQAKRAASNFLTRW